MKINASARLLAPVEVTATVEYGSPEYKQWLVLSKELTGASGLGKGLEELFTNLGRWFEGYLGHHSVNWDAKSIKLLASQLKAIEKAYPTTLPKKAYRVTAIQTKKGTPTEALYDLTTVNDVRKILSFSADPKYPKTFWNRVRGQGIKDDLKVKGIRDEMLKRKTDWAAVVYEVSVTSANVAGTYDSVLEFAKATKDCYDALIAEIKRKPENKGRKFHGGSAIIGGFKGAMRPFIQRQKEVILLFPSEKIKGQVVDVLFNSADLKR